MQTLVKIVRENIGFERGQTVRSALKIGVIEQNKDPKVFIENLVNSFDFIINGYYVGRADIYYPLGKFFPKGSNEFSVLTKTRIFSQVNEIETWIKQNTGKNMYDWKYSAGVDYTNGNGGHWYTFVVLPENIKAKRSFFRTKFKNENS